MQTLPGSLFLAETAFFFDFDGTLVELAPTPDGIVVPRTVPDILASLRRATNGAVAVVSGRGIDSIDAFLGMPDLPVAGLHGAERRDSNGDVQRVGFNDERLLRMEHALERVVNANPGMLLEIKGAALALHSAQQVTVEPPTFALRVNHPDGVHFSYERYLVKSLRRAFGFEGSPIRLSLRKAPGARARGARGARR